MALAECYLPATQPSVRRHVAHAHPRAALACPPPAPAPDPSSGHVHSGLHNAWTNPHRSQRQPVKDYSKPLHVDCSVEYELPECAKPPRGVAVEPLLMIHPAHFRRLDSLRRCPFVNNLPAASSGDAFELPPPRRTVNPASATTASRRTACRRTSPRWAAGVGVAACCRPLAAAVGAAPPPPDLIAPKEGDTLETSALAANGGKCAAPRYRRTACRPHPYAPPSIVDPPPAHKDTHLPPDCDKTFDALQGNPLISPFHAKMFTSDSVYQNYPIVMYK